MQKLFIYLFVLLPAMVFSQSRQYEIPWEKNDSMIHFVHASYLHYNNPVPHFTTNIPWLHSGLLPKVSLAVKSSSPIDNRYMQSIGELAPGNTPELKYRIVYEKKQAVLQLSVVTSLIILSPVN